MIWFEKFLSGGMGPPPPSRPRFKPSLYIFSRAKFERSKN
nr:MAG TPA: hypothetical protein [Caudoviricetes sp.]